jgi:hypothetical protein
MGPHHRPTRRATGHRSRPARGRARTDMSTPSAHEYCVGPGRRTPEINHLGRKRERTRKYRLECPGFEHTWAHRRSGRRRAFLGRSSSSRRESRDSRHSWPDPSEPAHERCPQSHSRPGAAGRVSIRNALRSSSQETVVQSSTRAGRIWG